METTIVVLVIAFVLVSVVAICGMGFAIALLAKDNYRSMVFHERVMGKMGEMQGEMVKGVGGIIGDVMKTSFGRDDVRVEMEKPAVYGDMEDEPAYPPDDTEPSDIVWPIPAREMAGGLAPGESIPGIFLRGEPIVPTPEPNLAGETYGM